MIIHTHCRIQINSFKLESMVDGVVAHWFNPLTLQPEQSGGVGSIPGRAPKHINMKRGRKLE